MRSRGKLPADGDGGSVSLPDPAQPVGA
jgi:hypothetical protein